MIMEKVTKQQIYHKLCYNFTTFLPIILVLLVLFSFFFFFSVSESSPSLLTLLIALLSTMFLVTLTKKKGSPPENLVQDNLLKLELQPSLGDVTQTESETAQRHKQQAEAQSHSSFPLDCESSNIMDKIFELSAQKYKQQADPQSDSSLPSDSESSTGSITGESFEFDHNRNQNLDISNSLASENGDEEEEEDGLIEINLPSRHFSGLAEDPKQKLETNLPESILKQQGLTELLAEINEMNEDENLIEIDISMGSTKYEELRLNELAYLGDQCVLSV